MITKVTERHTGNLPKPIINFLKSHKVFKRSLTEMDTDIGNDYGTEDTLTIYKAGLNQLDDWDRFQAKEGCSVSHLPSLPIDANGRHVLIAFGDTKRYTEETLYIPESAQHKDAILVYVILDDSMYQALKKKISMAKTKRADQQQQKRRLSTNTKKKQLVNFLRRKH